MKRKRDLCLLVLALAGLSVYFVQLRFWLTEDPVITSYQLLADGKAYLPCQYRFLVPWTAHAMSVIAPLSLLDAYKLLEMTSVLFLFVTFRYLLGHFYRLRDPWICAISIIYPLLFIYVLPPWARRQPYDIWSVAFTCAGLLLLAKKQYRAFYPLFALATLNNEKTCFLTVAQLLMLWGDTPKCRLCLHVLAQLIIWTALKYPLYLYYLGNPQHANTALFMLPVFQNLKWLSSPLNCLFLCSAFGFAWIPVLFNYHRIDQMTVRRLLWLAIPFCAGMLLVGILREIRIFGELTPVVWLAFVGIFCRRDESVQPSGGGYGSPGAGSPSPHR